MSSPPPRRDDGSEVGSVKHSMSMNHLGDAIQNPALGTYVAVRTGLSISSHLIFLSHSAHFRFSFFFLFFSPAYTRTFTHICPNTREKMKVAFETAGAEGGQRLARVMQRMKPRVHRHVFPKSRCTRLTSHSNLTFCRSPLFPSVSLFDRWPRAEDSLSHTTRPEEEEEEGAAASPAGRHHNIRMAAA